MGGEEWCHEPKKLDRGMNMKTEKEEVEKSLFLLAERLRLYAGKWVRARNTRKKQTSMNNTSSPASSCHPFKKILQTICARSILLHLNHHLHDHLYPPPLLFSPPSGSFLLCCSASTHNFNTPPTHTHILHWEKPREHTFRPEFPVYKNQLGNQVLNGVVWLSWVGLEAQKICDVPGGERTNNHMYRKENFFLIYKKKI